MAMRAFVLGLEEKERKAGSDFEVACGATTGVKPFGM